ncbi:uncharacterized protein LOC127870998 isoform X2 [Dreissena polymorpha]|uniref:Uncharacterized protein n=1 Tax=Dreissena polymorpha TaxID=45954 RepID=A0A9D4JGG5_DREPO|nr:uncharacterized protein LOC127833342 isoform X2 [Dreissena polymorpha]XP_052269575.1 uncharacterized protein LOC127870998 isoform X2 [Dreissena polymorpha]KAH3806767.1 hypothetical protein DPMN_135093 [Dreissena polymorpha]
MNARNEKLSAWHRLTTVVSIKGHFDNSALTLFNRTGLTMSTSSKLRLLDEAGEMLEDNIARSLRKNPLVKITGDNLDIYVRTGHHSLDRHEKDLHMFASNIIFSRIAQLESFSTSFTMPSLGTLSPEKFFPNGHHRDTLTNTYCVLEEYWQSLKTSPGFKKCSQPTFIIFTKPR